MKIDFTSFGSLTKLIQWAKSLGYKKSCKNISKFFNNFCDKYALKVFEYELLLGTLGWIINEQILNSSDGSTNLEFRIYEFL